MSDTHQNKDNLHPEEMLAVYVDGSASDEDRRTVEAHLAGCERCRSEVRLATSARAALVSLPELAAPGLAAAGLDAFRQPAVQPPADAPTKDLGAVREARERGRRIHWDRLALGAGLAAAAGLFVIFAVVGLTRHNGSTTGPAANSAASGLPPVITRGATYSQVSLQALASRLEAPAREGKAVRAPVVGVPNNESVQAPAASPGFGANTPPDQTAVLSCLRAASGLGPTAKPIYLEAADFQGTPAFVGAFVTPPVASGGASHLLVVAASRNGCQPLYVLRQSL